MPDPSSDSRPQVRLDMFGGSQTATIGTVETRVVGGNMYSTTLTYTNNVFTAPPPNVGSGSTGEAKALSSDARFFPWNTLELRTLLQRILRPFWLNSQDIGAKGNFLLSNLDEQSDRPLPQKTPGEAYVSAMLHAGKGLPCWKPRPRKPTKDGEGVLIGDVGIFSVEGGFRKIFNLWDDEEPARTYLSAASDDKRIPYQIPSKPQPFIEENELVTGDSVARGAWSETIYEADNRTIAQFEFHHLEPHKQGGVLAMTSAGKLEELDEDDKLDLREFISQHAGHIYTYANSIRPIDDHEALYIISGCIKSETWGLAAFTDPVMHPLHTPRLVRMSDPHAVDHPHRPIQPTFAWRSLGTFDAYVGRSDVSGSQDQTLFLRGFKLDFSQTFRAQEKRKRSLVTRGRGPSGSWGGSPQSPGSDRSHPGDGQDLNPGEGHSDRDPNPPPGRPQGGEGGAHDSVQNDSDITITSFPDDSSQEPFHPCDIINRLLLMKTGLDFSLSHDDDWAYLVGKCTVSEEGNQEKQHIGSTKLMGMDEYEVSQLCAISVRHGVASLSFEKLAVGSFAEKGKVPAAQSSDAELGNFVDLPTHPQEVSAAVSVGGAENLASVVEEIKGPSSVIAPATQETANFDTLFTVYEAEDESLSLRQQFKKELDKVTEQADLKPEKKRGSAGKSMSETFIIVRPPPSRTNHPLNLQVQLVPPRPQPQSANYSKAHSLSAETLVPSLEDPSATSTPTAERGARRIIPLYNLQAHNVMINVITDAGTDAKITRFQKKGVELVDLVVLEPVEVWGERSASGKKQAKDRAMCITVTETGSIVLAPPDPASKQNAESPEPSHPLTPSLNSSPQVQASASSESRLREAPPPYQPYAVPNEHNSVRDFAGNSGVVPQAPQAQQRFAAVRRWLSTSRRKPLQERSRADARKSSQEDTVNKAPEDLNIDQMRMEPNSDMDTPETIISADPSQYLTLFPLQLRPPILGTQAVYISASKPQTQDASAVEGIGEDMPNTQQGGGDTRDCGSPTEDPVPWTGGESVGPRVGSIFDAASVISRASSLTLVGSSAGDFSDSEQAKERERAEMYVWLAVKWLKKRNVPPHPMGRRQRRGSSIGQPAFSPRVGGGVEVRFEWTRTKGKSRGNVKADVKEISPELPMDYYGEDDEDEDPEDPEAPWVCTLKIRKAEHVRASIDSKLAVGATAEGRPFPTPKDPGAAGPGRGGSQEGKEEGESTSTLKLKVGVISPTPHHPKVVAQLKIPFPLPDVEVERMVVVKRKSLPGQTGGEGVGRDEPYYGLTLAAEEIKDIVCSTGLWLVVRESMGGVGRVSRKGDGWRIRENDRASFQPLYMGKGD